MVFEGINRQPLAYRDVSFLLNKQVTYDIIVNLDLSCDVNSQVINQLVDKGKIFFCEQHNNEVRESKLSVIHKSKNGFFKQSLFDINIPFIKTVNNLNDFNFI